MFGRKKTDKNEKGAEKPRKGKDDLAAMFGLQMPDDDDDDDLEAELAALQGHPVKKKSGQKKTPMSMAEIEKLAAASKKIGDDLDDDDDDEDFDESALLAELADLSDDDDEDEALLEEIASPTPRQRPPAPSHITPTQQTAPPMVASAPATLPSASTAASSPAGIVLGRLAMYQAAVKHAKEKGDTSKARRYERGLKTLDALAKKVKSGAKIDMEEVPPELPASATDGAVTQPSPAHRTNTSDTINSSASDTTAAAAVQTAASGSLSAVRPATQGVSPVAKPRAPKPTPSAQVTSAPVPQSRPAPATTATAAVAASAASPTSMPSSPPAAAAAAANGSPTRRLLSERMSQYLRASRAATNPADVRQLKITAARFQKVIKAYDSGQPIDLALMPSPPPGMTSSQRQPEQASPAQSIAATRSTPQAAATAAVSEPASEAQAEAAIPVPTTVLEGLTQRLLKYSTAQKQAQEAGESGKVRRMGRIVKQYQDAIKATRANRKFDYTELPCPPGYPPLPIAGQATPSLAVARGAAGGASPVNSLTSSSAGTPIDLANMSPPPPGMTSSQRQPEQASPVQSIAATRSTPQAAATAAASEPASEAQAETAIPVPTTVLEGLTQRLLKYSTAQKQAQEAGESGKARRMERIAKQYQDAIKATKANRKFDYTELPCPPGYPPLPIAGQATSSLVAAAGAAAAGAAAAAAASPVNSLTSSSAGTSGAAMSGQSQNDIQRQAVKGRYEEYKSAALAAKGAGRTAEAVAYFKTAKGMEAMLAAAESGLPIDMSELPAALNPSTASSVEQKKRSRTEDDAEVFERLAEVLSEQIATCAQNGEQYKLAGDVKGASAFEIEAASLQADLDMLKSSDKYGEAAPRFHYEQREFSIVRSFPEMGDSDCDVVLDQCHSLPLPSGYKEKDLYTYVNVTFPFPHDDEPTEKTHTVKSSVNPVFDESLRFSIDRKSRSLARTLKRHPVRLEVMYERGFLKSDQSLGVGSIPLGDLETNSEVHASVDLMEGRKACGGKIEARIRIRQPLTGQDIQKTKHKWLVIDDYANMKSQKRTIPPPQAAQRVKQGATSSSSSSGSQPLQCIEVLKFEKQRLEKMMLEYRSKKQPIPAQVQQRHKAASERAAALEAKLRSGGKPFLRSYVAQLKAGADEQQARAKQLLQSGDKTGAHTALQYKKLMSSELEKWANSSL